MKVVHYAGSSQLPGPQLREQESFARVTIKAGSASKTVDVPLSPRLRTEAQYAAAAITFSPKDSVLRDLALKANQKLAVRPTGGAGTMRAFGPLGVLSQVLGLAADLKEANDPKRVAELADLVDAGHLDMNVLMLQSMVLYNAVREERARRFREGVMA